MSAPRPTTYVVRPPRGQENSGAALRFLESRPFAVSLIAASFLLAACGEKPQILGARKAETQAYQGAAAAFTAPGWKTGDAASWELQMKKRAEAQNEYARASAP